MGVLQRESTNATCVTNISLLIARCFPGSIEHSFLSVFHLLSVLGTYAWTTGCLRIRVLISPLMLSSYAYDNHFNNILSQCKEIRTSAAFYFASKDEGVQEIISLASFLKFTQRQRIYAYACWIQLLHQEYMHSSSDSDEVMVLGLDKC